MLLKDAILARTRGPRETGKRMSQVPFLCGVPAVASIEAGSHMWLLNTGNVAYLN